MDQTQTDATASAHVGEAPPIPPGIEEGVLKELAEKAPDITFTTAGEPGFQEERKANGELVNRVAVTGAGVPVRTQPAMEPRAEDAAQEPAATEGAATGPEGTPEEPAAEQRAAADAGEQPPAGDAKQEAEPAKTEEPAAPAAPTDEELAAARTRAVAAAGQQVTEPANKPEAETPPELDWSDEPDWTDGTKYKTEEEANEARRKYMAEKTEAHAQALVEFNARQSQRTQAAAAAEYEQNAMAARQLETAAQLQRRLGFDEEKFRTAAQDYSMVRHPSPADPRVPNPVAQYLTTARDTFLVQRARQGLPVADQESVAEILEAQFADMEFARKMAGVVPDDVTGGIVMTAVAQLPAPVRVLKHLVGDDGRQYVNDVVRRYGNGRHLTVPQRSAVLNEVMMDLIRTDAGLTAAPPKQAKESPSPSNARPAPAVQANAGAAGTSGAAGAGPGRFTEKEPAAPRSTPAPAHTAPPPGGGPEAFSDAWIADEVKKAKAGAYAHLF